MAAFVRDVSARTGPSGRWLGSVPARVRGRATCSRSIVPGEYDERLLPAAAGGVTIAFGVDDLLAGPGRAARGRDRDRRRRRLGGRRIRRSAIRRLRLAVLSRPRRQHLRAAAGPRAVGRSRSEATLDRPDPPGSPAELLDHRPHRPRQVDPRRPAPRADPHRRRPAHDEPGPRLDGSRAREGDHDQGACRPPRVPGEGRSDLRPEPDRHARSRRLRVRGQPQPPGLRGRDPRRRCHPGDRGPDARQRPPRDARGADPDPGPEQDRPALGRPRNDHGRARERPRDPARGGPPRQRQGRHRRPRHPRGDRVAHPGSEGRPGASRSRA